MARQTVSNLEIRKRILLMLIMVILITFSLILRLGYLQFVRGEELEEMAWDQWNRALPYGAQRGTISDRYGRLLAGSASAETVVALPGQIDDPRRTAAMLAPLLEMKEEDIYRLVTQQKAAVYIKRKIEAEEARSVRQLNLPGITFTQESKRYYPNGRLASQLLGFVGADQGWSGLEIYYEDQLKGRDGMVFFPSDNRGRELPHDVRSILPPQNGLNLVLTIDQTMQFILERELARAMIEFEPLRAMALAVDPRTGEVLAAASQPDFDPADYAAYDQQSWLLAPVTHTFEPGSTFKLTTLAAAIEEGLYSQTEGFFCSGSVTVSGTTIGCWTSSSGGHGAISYLEVVQSSCNPGFIQLGQRLGKDKLLNYIRAFGYGERTGIDYPGEGTGIVFGHDRMGPVELATTSFGQGVSVTPLQQAMAVSALANGGYLMRPYIVKEIRDDEGRIIMQRKPETVRQVVSQQTAKEVALIMESVVREGSGKNAYIEGYRIAGKTGTAQKVGPQGTYLPGDYLLSLIGFATIDEPRVLLYVAVDTAGRGPQWGSQVSAPLFRRMMDDILKYLEIAPHSVEQAARLVEVPDLAGLDTGEAALLLGERGLLISPLGDRTTITHQVPAAGARVPLQHEVIVYTGSDGQPAELSVPDLHGRTMPEVAAILDWLDLEWQAIGSGVAAEQSVAPGTPVPRGTRIVVTFRSSIDG